MSIKRQLQRLASAAEDDRKRREELFNTLMAKDAGEIIAYVTLVGDISPLDVMVMAVSSTGYDVNALKRLVTEYGFTWHDVRDPAERDKVVALVAAQENMTTAKASEYIDEEYPGRVALENNDTHEVTFLDVNEDAWGQLRHIIGEEFTMSEVAPAVQVVCESSQDSHEMFVAQLTYDLVRYTEDELVDMYDAITNGMSAEDAVDYITTLTQLNAIDITKIAVNSLHGKAQLRALMDLFGITVYDPTRPDEMAELMQVVADHRGMTPEEATAYIKAEFPDDCLAYGKPNAYGVEFFDPRSTWYDQVDYLQPFTMADATAVTEIAFSDGRSRDMFAEILTNMLDDNGW